jgi:hypothetical protein
MAHNLLLWKFFEILVKYSIPLLSSRCPSSADQLPTPALPALPSTWPSYRYLLDWNQDVVVGGGVSLAYEPSRRSVPHIRFQP